MSASMVPSELEKLENNRRKVLNIIFSALLGCSIVCTCDG